MKTNRPTNCPTDWPTDRTTDRPTDRPSYTKSTKKKGRRFKKKGNKNVCPLQSPVKNKPISKLTSNVKNLEKIRKQNSLSVRRLPQMCQTCPKVGPLVWAVCHKKKSWAASVKMNPSYFSEKFFFAFLCTLMHSLMAGRQGSTGTTTLTLTGRTRRTT